MAAARRAKPTPRLLTKRDLCREAGISRTTLDEWIAADPGFPVVKRGTGNGESWQFDADAALAHIERNAPGKTRQKGDLSPNQQFMALRVAREERKLAEEAGSLVRADQMSVALRRSLVALSRRLTGLPVVLAETVGLTVEQQRLVRKAIEDELRSFVAGLKETGLPDDDME